jgi:LCP family protein required for cell wall assembly
MSETSTQDFFTRQAEEARGPEPQEPPKRKRRRLKRVIIASSVSLVVMLGAVVGGSVLYINHEVSSIHRVPVAALTAAHKPAEAHGAMNVLLTDTGVMPHASYDTGFIEVLHLNANQQGGAVISFPANVIVSVPGRGQMQLGQTLAVGGPSLMIATLEKLTHIRIDHYAAIDFAGLTDAVNAMGGVDVDVPYTTTSFGWTFHRGINHLAGVTRGVASDVLAYVRQPAVSEVGRMQLQENLLRAILRKIARRNFFERGFANFRVLNAIVDALTVDSDFGPSQLRHLALRLGDLEGRDGVSIDVPTTGSPRTGGTSSVVLIHKLSSKLWHAVRHDQVMAFAHRYPFTVTPIAPG